MKINYVIGDSISGEDIKRLRSILGMTQEEFAHFVNCSKRTVENWEMKTENRVKKTRYSLL